MKATKINSNPWSVNYTYRGKSFRRDKKTPHGYYGTYIIGKYGAASSMAEALNIIDRMLDK